MYTGFDSWLFILSKSSLQDINKVSYIVYLEFACYLSWAINRPYGQSAGNSNNFSVIVLTDRHSVMKFVNNLAETSYFINIFNIRDIIVILLFTFSCQSGHVYSGKMHVLEIISCLMTSLQSSEVTNLIFY